MAKPKYIELQGGEKAAVLYEDRAVLAIDKPTGWLLAPDSWHNTSRNLQLELMAGIRHGAFWARSRNLKYLRFVHRLDAETSGVLLLGKSPGAVSTFSALFESRRMEKEYLAVVLGTPVQSEWVSRDPLSPDPDRKGKMVVDRRHGKTAETKFIVVASKGGRSLVEAHPFTGRTHQIRVHLASAGHPVLGDDLYGQGHNTEPSLPLALRSVSLAYADPFTSRRVRIRAPVYEFARQYGFEYGEGGPVQI